MSMLISKYYQLNFHLPNIRSPRSNREEAKKDFPTNSISSPTSLRLNSFNTRKIKKKLLIPISMSPNSYKCYSPNDLIISSPPRKAEKIRVRLPKIQNFSEIFENEKGTKKSEIPEKDLNDLQVDYKEIATGTERGFEDIF